MSYLIGLPLIPPLALTQSKYVFAAKPEELELSATVMLTMLPIGIGAPVAGFPLLKPQSPDAILTYAMQKWRVLDSITAELGPKRAQCGRLPNLRFSQNIRLLTPSCAPVLR